MITCHGQGADLHMAQLMPPPLTISCFSESRLVLPFWCWLNDVVLDKIQEGCKMVVCVCVCVCMCACVHACVKNNIVVENVTCLITNLSEMRNYVMSNESQPFTARICECSKNTSCDTATPVIVERSLWTSQNISHKLHTTLCKR